MQDSSPRDVSTCSRSRGVLRTKDTKGLRLGSVFIDLGSVLSKSWTANWCGKLVEAQREIAQKSLSIRLVVEVAEPLQQAHRLSDLPSVGGHRYQKQTKRKGSLLSKTSQSSLSD